MKKITLLFFMIATSFSFAQVGISENFDAGTPTGWVDTYANTSTTPCAGNSERDNLWSSSTTGNLTSPNQVGLSNGTDLTVSFDYKIIDYTGGGATVAGWGSAELQYSTDDGATWTSVLTIDDTNHVASTSCANMMVVIPAASLPAASDVKLQVANTWLAGDYYFYIDNFSATQVVATPPNCDSVLSATTNVSVAGDISWSAATGIPTGYNLTVGTATGLSDVLATTDVGLVTSYNLGLLSYSTMYYVTIEPYNANGMATGCTEQTFTTEAQPPAGTDCFNPLMATVEADCSTATPLTLDFTTATDIGAAGSCDTTTGNMGFWVEFTAPGSGTIAITSTGANNEFVILDTCGGTEVACATLTGDDQFSGLTPASTYILAVWKDSFNTMTADDFCIAEVLCTPPVATATLVEDCAGGTFSIDVDVTSFGDGTTAFVNDGSGAVAVTMGINTFGPYPISSPITLTLDHESDPVCSGIDLGTFIDACPPANDDCVNAIPVACGDVVTGSTAAATDSGNNASADVWYSFTGTGTVQDVTVSLCNSAYDTYIRVFDSCGGTEIVGNDDSCSTQSEATFTSDGTSTYYIMIEGYSTSTGTYELAVTCMANIPPPANDECATATALTLGTALTGETNAGATQSVGDQPTCDSFGFIADVWYTFVAPASGEVTIQTTLGTASEASIAVYDDCANLDANSLGCTLADGVNGSLAVTGLTGGTTYYVKIWNDGTVAAPSTGARSEGSFDIFAEDTVVLGVQDSQFSGFKYFPNPVQGTLSLRAQDNMQNVAVYNMLGQEVINISPNAMSNDLDMSALSRGAYFVKVSINGAVENFKIIKE